VVRLGVGSGWFVCLVFFFDFFAFLVSSSEEAELSEEEEELLSLFFLDFFLGCSDYCSGCLGLVSSLKWTGLSPKRCSFWLNVAS
jgi:hypothetical protein